MQESPVKADTLLEPLLTATTDEHADELRRQFPERHALKNRQHYLLTRPRGFSLWEENGKPIADFALWQQQKKTAVRNLSDVENLPARIRTLKSAQDLAQAVANIFDYAGGPIEFDELVSADDENGRFDLATKDPDPAWRI